MELKFDKKTLRRIIFAVLGVMLIYWLLHEPDRVKSIFGTIMDIITPFIIGGVLAFILNVPMRAFENLLKGIKHEKLRRIVALLLTMLCAALIVALVFVLLIPELTDTLRQLGPKAVETFNRMWARLSAFLDQHPDVKEWFNSNFDLKSFDWSTFVEKIMNALSSGLNFLVPQAFTAIGSVVNYLISFFIGIAFALYSLFQKETLARQGRKVLYALIPEKTADYVVKTLRLTNSTFSNFLSGQCVEVCILGCMFAVTMAIFRMPYIPLISVLVAVTAFIPVVGAWAGCIIGAFLIFMHNPIQAIWFIIMFIILQAVENNFIYPRVAGNSVGLSGMWVLIAIAVGSKLMGVVGMFLMIPITSVIYVMIRDAINKKLGTKEVPVEKLQPQPPELTSRFIFKFKFKKKNKTKK